MLERYCLMVVTICPAPGLGRGLPSAVVPEANCSMKSAYASSPSLVDTLNLALDIPTM